MSIHKPMGSDSRRCVGLQFARAVQSPKQGPDGVGCWSRGRTGHRRRGGYGHWSRGRSRRPRRSFGVGAGSRADRAEAGSRAWCGPAQESHRSPWQERRHPLEQVTEQGAAPEREPRRRWSKVGSPDVGRRLRSGDQNRAAAVTGQGPEQERAGR